MATSHFRWIGIDSGSHNTRIVTKSSCASTKKSYLFNDPDHPIIGDGAENKYWIFRNSPIDFTVSDQQEKITYKLISAGKPTYIYPFADFLKLFFKESLSSLERVFPSLLFPIEGHLSIDNRVIREINYHYGYKRLNELLGTNGIYAVPKDIALMHAMAPYVQDKRKKSREISFGILDLGAEQATISIGRVLEDGTYILLETYPPNGNGDIKPEQRGGGEGLTQAIRRDIGKDVSDRILISRSAAEGIKQEVGESAKPEKSSKITVSGMDATGYMRKELTVRFQDIIDLMEASAPYKNLVELIKPAMGSNELSQNDFRGIYVVGGGSKNKPLLHLLKKEFGYGFKPFSPLDPERVLIIGLQKMIQDYAALSRYTAKLAPL